MSKKFKTLFTMLMLGVLMYAPRAMALSCSKNSDGDLVIKTSKDITIGAQIPNTVSLVITIIKIAVPVLLVVLGMMDLMKGVTSQKEDEIKKAQQLFVKRIVAAILVFFVVTIVQLLLNFADSEDDADSADGKESGSLWTCTNCFLNGMNKCGS